MDKKTRNKLNLSKAFKKNIDKYGIINLIIWIFIPTILVVILYGNSNKNTEDIDNQDIEYVETEKAISTDKTKKYKYYNENPNLPKFDSVISEAILDSCQLNLYKYVIGKNKGIAEDYFVEYIYEISKEGFEYEESTLSGKQIFYIYDSNSVEVAKCFLGYENSNYIFTIGIY